MGAIFSKPTATEQQSQSQESRHQKPPKASKQNPAKIEHKNIPIREPKSIEINKFFVPERIDDPGEGENCGLFIDGLNFHWEREKFFKFLKHYDIHFTSAIKKKSKVFGTVTFDNNEDRQDAYQKLKDLTVGKKHLFIVGLYKKLETSEKLCNRLRARAESDLNTRDIDDKIAPWHSLPYEEQLQKKAEKFTSIIAPIIPNQDLIKVFPAPKIAGYRNKAELTIGRDINGEICVGFNLGSRVEDMIAPVKTTFNCPDRTPELAEKLRQFIVKSGVPVFDRTESKGNWKFVLIRTNEAGEVMMQVVVYKSIGEENINALKEAFQNEVTSLYYCETDVFEAYGKNPKIIHLSGPEVIIEKLRGLKFEISPMSFFQTNTPGAELLFQKIEELAQVDKNTVLIDVCCGTGVIGLSLAKNAKFVVGVDIEEQAILDARRNAEINQIKNTEFIADKAEAALSNIISKYAVDGQKVIAIVDPPRCGLHKKALLALRQCPQLNRLVYISCNANSLVNDASRYLFNDNDKKSKPFAPTKWFGVDMFPHTDRCEIVMLMERK